MVKVSHFLAKPDACDAIPKLRLNLSESLGTSGHKLPHSCLLRFKYCFLMQMLLQMVQNNHPFMSNGAEDSLPEEVVQERLGLVEPSHVNIRIVPEKRKLDPYKYVDFLDGPPGPAQQLTPASAADADLEAVKRRSAERARLHMTGNGASRSASRCPL
jgi:hypothetical protein